MNMKANGLLIRPSLVHYVGITVFLCALIILVVLTPITITTDERVSLANADTVVDLWFAKFCVSGTCTLNSVSERCKNGGTCTEDELTILSLVAQCSAGASVVSWSGASFACSGEQLKQADQAKKILEAAPTSCTASLTNWAPIFTPTCWMRVVSAGVAAVLIQIGAFFLAIAGFLFNTLVQYTIVEFGKYYLMIKDGVELGWSAFRDIVNIVIIGIFTFITISIILGIEKYGQKKLIARVLIIAVLLNFSLLFTKLIIDGSNFTALQLYSAMKLPSQAAASGFNPIQGFAQEGIAGKFVNLIGMSSFQDSYALLRQKADKNDDTLSTFVYGIGSALLLFGAALVLFYGCYIVATRAILLIFLLLTSPIAFASFLIPGSEDRSMGWRTWWSSLLSAAVLAPLLMALLWATIAIGVALKKGLEEAGGGIGTLGDLMANPGQPDNLAALFMYVLLLGLLYKCFQISQEFSSGIMRFDFTGGILKNTLAAPFANAFRLAGFGLRQTAGWAGLRYQKSQQAEGQGLRDKAGGLRTRQDQAFRDGNFGQATVFGKAAKQLEEKAAGKFKRAAYGGMVADSKFNLMNTKAAKTTMEAMGVKGFAAGASSKDVQSYAGRIKKDAEQAEKRARAAAVSGDDETKIRTSMEKQIVEERRAAREEKMSAKENADKVVKTLREEIGKERAGFEKSLTTATQTLTKHQEKAAENEKQYAEELSKLVSKGANSEEITRRKAARESQLLTEKANIESAKAEVEKHQSSIGTVDQKFAERLAEATRNVQGLTSEIDELGDRGATEKAIKRASDEHIAAVKRSAQEIAGNVEYGVIRTPAQRASVAKEVRSKFKTNVGSASIREALEEYIKTGAGGDAKPESGGGDKKPGK